MHVRPAWLPPFGQFANYSFRNEIPLRMHDKIFIK